MGHPSRDRPARPKNTQMYVDSKYTQMYVDIKYTQMYVDNKDILCKRAEEVGAAAGKGLLRGGRRTRSRQYKTETPEDKPNG